MKRMTFITFALMLILAACSPSSDLPVFNDSPVSSDDTPAPQMKDFRPKPEDEKMMRNNVYLDSTDLLTLESYPLQFMLTISGNLPTPCHQLRVMTNPPDAENRIHIEVYSVTNPDAMCAEVLQPFNVNISLGSFPEGEYTLWINGELAAEFQA